MGKNIQKWDPKTRQGQYSNKSPNYARTVGLIQNTQTYYIYQQFHLMYMIKPNQNIMVMGGYGDNEVVINYTWDNLICHRHTHTHTHA